MMNLKPELALLLDSYTYLFFLEHKGKYASVIIDMKDKESPPRVARYFDVLEYYGAQNIAEGIPDALDLPCEDYEVRWDFTPEGKMGVRGRIVPTNSGKNPEQD